MVCHYTSNENGCQLIQLGHNMNREVVSYHDIVECLSATLEAKDSYTEGHSSRVADMVCDVCHHWYLTGDIHHIPCLLP